MRWLVVALCACNTEDADSGTIPAPTCGEPSLSVGTGSFSYAPFAATDPSAEVIYGQQGGWHVWVAGDIVGIGPKIVQTPTLTLVDTGTIIAGDPPLPEGVDLSVPPPSTGLLTGIHGLQTECGWQFAGGHAFLLDNLFGGGKTNVEAIRGLDGLAARLDVSVSDLETGEIVSGGADLVLAITNASIPD
jgi:hypothetical protein